MYSFISLIAISSFATAATIQQPLRQSDVGQILISSKELVSSEALEAHITQKNLLKRAKKLYEIAELGAEEYNHPTRVIGSKGHIGTIDYIYSTIAELGDYYEISNQTFNAIMGNVFESRLVIGDKEPKSTLPMSLTPPTKNRDVVSGNLVLVANNGCDKSDYPSTIDGAIALIQRGTCSFGVKSSEAGKAGAIAAVIYNNEDGRVSGTLGDAYHDHVATFGISREDAKPIIKKLEAGEVIPSSAYIDAIVVDAATTNIIAQTRGGDQDNCVMAGAHSDSVSEGPGINDDGSGSLTLLEVATHLTNYKVNNCVRFAWWAGEEEGLLGSDYYVGQLSDEENEKIRLFMDYDMLASPNYAYQIYNATDDLNPVGSEALRDLYIKYYKDHGVPYTFIPFDGRSDYDAFIKHGIPGGGIATGAEGIKTKEEEKLFGGKAGDWYDPCYHQLCDNLDNLAMDAWELNTKLVAHSVATYAVSFKDFPKRVVKDMDLLGAPTLSPYHGPRLFL